MEIILFFRKQYAYRKIRDLNGIKIFRQDQKSFVIKKLQGMDPKFVIYVYRSFSFAPAPGFAIEDNSHSQLGGSGWPGMQMIIIRTCVRPHT